MTLLNTDVAIKGKIILNGCGIDYFAETIKDYK